MEYPQIDVRDLCSALGVEYETAKSATFYLHMVKEYVIRYNAAQQSVEPTVESDEPLPADKNLKARIKLL